MAVGFVVMVLLVDGKVGILVRVVGRSVGAVVMVLLADGEDGGSARASRLSVGLVKVLLNVGGEGCEADVCSVCEGVTEGTVFVTLAAVPVMVDVVRKAEL